MDRVVFNFIEKPAKNIQDISVGPLVSDEEMANRVSLKYPSTSFLYKQFCLAAKCVFLSNFLILLLPIVQSISPSRP